MNLFEKFIHTNKKLLFIFLTLIIIYNTVNTKEGYNSALTFDNTQKWGTMQIKAAMNLSDDNKAILNRLPIIPPTKNNSTETKREIKDLLKKQKNRTKEIYKNILKERSLTYCIAQFAQNVEEQKKLSDFLTTTVQPIHLAMKHHFNRVRPTFLESKLKAAIDIPQHASYPSGHATEAYMLANIMSKKYPNQRENFFAKAKKIATNRERAGLHYKSDSEYGKKIAEKMFEIITKAGMNPFKLR
jgi:hypothetical protein